MKTLYTERLILRPFHKKDLDAFFAYSRDPRVGPNAGWPPHANIGESRSVLNHIIRRDCDWAIVVRSSQQLIGSISLQKDYRRTNSRVRNLGYSISSIFWGNGYATEAAKTVIQYAFQEMSLELISANHYPFNEASKKVILKCGFHFDGNLRRAGVRFDGKPYDDVCYSMTKEEYLRYQERGILP